MNVVSSPCQRQCELLSSLRRLSFVDYSFRPDPLRTVSQKMAPTCETNVQIKLTPKNFLLIIFNVVYIEVNETRKKL